MTALQRVFVWVPSARQNRSLVLAEARAARGPEGLTENERRGDVRVSRVSARDSPAMANWSRDARCLWVAIFAATRLRSSVNCSNWQRAIKKKAEHGSVAKYELNR